jgi:hypothetical protein
MTYSKLEYSKLLGTVCGESMPTIEEANDIVARAKQGNGIAAEQIYRVINFAPDAVGYEETTAKAIVQAGYDALFV